MRRRKTQYVDLCRTQMTMVPVLVLFSLWVVGIVADSFPTCGSCWCIPDNGGLGDCPSDWTPTTSFNSSVIKAYQSQVPSSIYTLNCNPYDDASCVTSPPQTMLNVSTAVCAYKYPTDEDGQQSCSTYSMVTYASEAEALVDGAVLTHAGSCGLCSTAQDLSIYLIEDFTAAGKKCASIGLFNEAKGLECYMNLGLTKECAKIWNYDGIYDGQACGVICTKELKDPNNGPAPACTLNDCLQCDEQKAGPIFTSYAGRSRRRSGLLSEIIRDCSSIAHIDHTPCTNPACQCT